jgi:hypothetical protein
MRCLPWAGFGVTGPLLLLTLLVPRALHSAEDGGQPEAWTKLALGARSAALGQAVSALPDDAGAALLNPALAVAQSQAEVGSQLAYLPDGRQLHYLGIARPFWQDSRFAWSLGYAQYTVGEDFERRKGNTGDPDSTFKESASQAQIGLAAWILEQRLSLGVNLRVLSHALGDANGGGVSSDLGFFWRSLPWLDVGLGLRDAASRLGWSTDTRESLPLKVRPALRGRAWQDRVNLLAEMEMSSQQTARLRAGLEVWPWPVLALRAGTDSSTWSTGLGLRWPWKGVGFGLDYALSSDPLGADALQQRLSLELSVPL